MTIERLAAYGTQRWRRRSREQLRAHPLCAMCLKNSEVAAATVADHVIPHRGDLQLFWFGDLQSLCKRHHDSVKQSEEKLGYSKEIGTDGWPRDPGHPVNKAQ